MKERYRQFIEKISSGGSTLRCRFMLYVTSAVLTSVLLLFLLLIFFGVMDPAGSRIEAYLDDQLYDHIAQTEHDMDKLAAYTLAFASQMEKTVQDYLDDEHIAFGELANDIQALTSIQTECYPIVYTNIRAVPCSGAFYILDTTVNDRSDSALYNGVYLRFANLYAESTVNTDVTLFRGSHIIARDNDINLFSTWQNEMKTDVFSDIGIFEEKSYVLSSVENLPDTWERARYIYSPIHDDDGSIIGICGYELSDLYLRLAYSADDKESNQVICALFDKTDGGYIGQFISNRSGYIPPECDKVIKKDRGTFSKYICGDHEYIGKQRDTVIGGNTLTVALMLPENQYVSIVRKGRLKSTAILLIFAVISFCICLWLSKKYIAPIRKSITRIKDDEPDYTPSGIYEIDDLFEFLAQKDRKNGEELARAETREAQIRGRLESVSSAHSEAQREIARLSYYRKNEVDPDDYKQFVAGVGTLTQTEHTVFDYYLSGKKVKEIIELMGVRETTVRFHNRNIYSKLGVNSLKQLLLYASVMNSEERDKKGT